MGKSILAVQIADRIARTDNVLYLDLELSEKQFQLRYTGEHGKLYTFPDRLYRVSLDSNSLLEDNFEEAIIGGMEQMALQTGCKIFIVDNLTYLCCAMEKGDAAGRLMIQLNNLKKRYGLSILVLAHTHVSFITFFISKLFWSHSCHAFKRRTEISGISKTHFATYFIYI